jgi:hypothetical protein
MRHPERRIVAILNARWGSHRVRDHIQVLHDSACLSLSDQIAAIKGKGDHLYPATFGQTRSGHRYEGKITCGHNPWLYARLVDDIRPSHDEHAVGGLKWKELPIPQGMP